MNRKNYPKGQKPNGLNKEKKSESENSIENEKAFNLLFPALAASNPRRVLEENAKDWFNDISKQSWYKLYQHYYGNIVRFDKKFKYSDFVYWLHQNHTEDWEEFVTYKLNKIYSYEKQAKKL